MVVYMTVSKDERMQNVVFQYNESQSSTEKYICFPPKYIILFPGELLPLRPHTDLRRARKKEKKGERKDSWQLISYLLFDFLIFFLEAFILEKHCWNTRTPVKHVSQIPMNYTVS